MLLDSKVKIKKNVLSKEECAKIIADSKNFVSTEFVSILLGVWTHINTISDSSQLSEL